MPLRIFAEVISLKAVQELYSSEELHFLIIYYTT